MVLDPRATRPCHDLDATLFILMTVGDERAVRATYVLGELAHSAPRAPAGP